MKFFSTILRFLWRAILLITAYCILLPLLWSPVYDFPEPQPFEGEMLYNPYAEIVPGEWHKGNFQVQTRMIGGITNGRNNTTADVYEIYEELGYDIVTVSDYMRINLDSASRVDFIPVYEHGYSWRKSHQVLIGAEQVNYFDYPLWQTVHNKQYILDQLADDNDITVIAHPKLRSGYSLEQMACLGNYQMIEVMNRYAMSWEHWDAALSAGKPVFMLANDDGHDLQDPLEAGRRISIINTISTNREHVVEALRAGRLYAYLPMLPWEGTLEALREKHKKIPQIESVEVRGDSVHMAFDEHIYQVALIGQGGDTVLQHRFEPGFFTNTFSYHFKPEYRYVRAFVEFKDYDKIWLNPIMRSEDGELPVAELARVNVWGTVWRRGAVWIVVLFGLVYWVKRRVLEN